MDFTMDLDYELYLESVMEEQIELEHCVNEALALSDGNLSKYREVFIESVGDKIKSGWQRFIGWIKKVWAKFTESLSNIFAGTKDYLDKYKDIILKKKVKDKFQVDIPNHGIGLQRIVDTSIDVLQPDGISDIITSVFNSNENDEKNANTVLNNNTQIQKLNKVYDDAKVNQDADQTERLDGLKRYFLGGESRTINMNELNMTDVFNTCYEKEKAINNITKEEKNFLANCENISKIFQEETDKFLNSIGSEAGRAKEEKPDKTKEDPEIKKRRDEARKEYERETKTVPKTGEMPSVNTQSGNSNFNGTGIADPGRETEESFMYSNLYGSYINEGIVSTKNSGSSNGGSSPGSGLGNAVSGTVRTKAADDKEYRDAASTTNTRMNNHGITDKETATKLVTNMKDALTNYRNRCGNVFTAKINALNTIYKNYFEIIRTHVRSYVGQEADASTDTAVRTGTKYTNPNEQKPAEQPAQK